MSTFNSCFVSCYSCSPLIQYIYVPVLVWAYFLQSRGRKIFITHPTLNPTACKALHALWYKITKPKDSVYNPPYINNKMFRIAFNIMNNQLWKFLNNVFYTFTS